MCYGLQTGISQVVEGSVYVLKYYIQNYKKKRGRENNRIGVSHDLLGSSVTPTVAMQNGAAERDSDQGQDWPGLRAHCPRALDCFEGSWLQGMTTVHLLCRPASF